MLKITDRKFVLYLLIITIIIQCHSLMDHIYPDHAFLIIILLLSFFLLYLKKIQISKKILFFLVPFLFSMGFLFIPGGFSSIEFLLTIVLGFFLYILFFFDDKQNINMTLEAISNVMFVISSISLFFFVFASVFHIIPATGYYDTSVVQWGNFEYQDYLHLYCEGQTIHALRYIGIRNIAFFVEAPMFIYPLLLAFYYELLLRENYRKKVIIVDLLAVITSFSATGLILITICLMFKFYHHILKSRVLKILMIPVILLIGGWVIYLFFLDKLTHGFSSVNVRLDDIKAAIKCFWNNPIKGIGYENMRGLDPFRLVLRRNAGLSTGLGGILAYGGLLWGIWYLIPYLVSIYRVIRRKGNYEYAGFILLSGILLLVTVVQTRMISVMVNALCWGMILQPYHEKGEQNEVG